MRRRTLLAMTAATGAAVAAGTNPVLADDRNSMKPSAAGDSVGLNPEGIRMAGIRMLPVVGGKYGVWTKRVGRGPIKVLLLHGGSGFSHEYLEAFESFLPAAGIEMYYYDQLGCNNSDVPDDSSLWTMERYVEEVEEVRRGLGLEGFVLYGHSWGGMLAAEYSLKYQRHLRGLIISNMAASTAAFEKRTEVLRRQLLSSKDYAAMLKLEAAGDFNSTEYQHLLNDILYPQMLCRNKPYPEPFTRTLRHANYDIYTQMFGPSEFHVTGNQKHWDRWDDLHRIKVKALTIGSKWDEMDPRDMKKMAELLPRGQFAYCPAGSHLCMWDDQEVYFRHLLGFLHSL